MMQTHSTGPTLSTVAQYYDRNTKSFLRFGSGESAAAIHRKVWAPGVKTRRQAFEYLHHVTAEALRPALQRQPDGELPRVLDLGCGVGGPATWLAGRLPAAVTGVTISPVQAGLAEERARRLGLADRCRFLLADFLDLPPLGPFSGAYAIEAFVHAADPDRFFAQAASQLAPGGRLVLCDDFLDEAAAALGPQTPARRALERFRSGWHVPCLQTGESAIRLAAENGLRLVENRDLTPYLRSFHPWVLWLVVTLTRLPLRGPYWENLSGGSALQMCIRSGWIRYRVLVFEKEEPCTPSPSNATLSPSTS
jgi:SAM-dependent methyltransferase